MKRILILILILSTAQYIYSAEYYESNVLGMALRKLADNRLSDFDFVLKVEKKGNREIRTLLSEGQIYFTRTIEQNEGVVIQTTVTDKKTDIVTRKNGIIVKEEAIYENNAEEMTEYFYQDRRLEYSETWIAGELLYIDIYSYTNHNRLLDVKREYAQQDESAVSSFIFKNGRISEYWSDRINGESYLSFNRNGLVFSEIVSDDNWRETREYGRLDNGNTFEIITDQVAGNRLRLEYDSSGRPEYSVLYNSDNKKLEEEYYTYQADKLVMLTVKKNLSTEKYIYSYDSDGTLAGETYEKNGNIIHQKIISDEANYVEILYRRGTPFMKITYADGERVKAEEYRETLND